MTQEVSMRCGGGAAAGGWRWLGSLLGAEAGVNLGQEDGADSLWLDDQCFAEYAAQLERQDWEDEVRRAAHTLYQLVEARRDTIEKLLLGADYLDSVWLRCRVSKTVGTSTSIIGGGLTIAGGIMTLATAGAGAPVLIAGIATSSVGAASNIGTSLIEKVVNSRQVKELNAAFGRDRELVEKLAGQVGSLEKFGESGRRVELLETAASLLGEQHLLLHIIKAALAASLLGEQHLLLHIIK